MPFVEAPTKPETELASNHKNYSKDAPTPEEIAYVNAFKLFLESYLRSRGYIFPKPEELKRSRQLPHYYYNTFIIDENGIVKLSDEAGFVIPVGIPNFSNSVKNYYSQLFSSIPRFVSPLEYKVAAPYKISIEISNALTKDGNRLYWLPYEMEKYFQDFDIGKLNAQ